MHILTFNVDGQRIIRTDKETPVAKCKNLFKASFEFLSDEWDGRKTAIFSQGGRSRAIILDRNNECIVPWEFFDADSESYGRVSVFCGDLVTANEEVIKIERSGYREFEISKLPTPDVYNQILIMLEDLTVNLPGRVEQEVEISVKKSVASLDEIKEYIK